METIQEKASFLKHELTQRLATLDPEMKGIWGKMNAHQMVEHMSKMFAIASGKIPCSLQTDDEILPKMQAFLHSDKPFRENTPNKLLPDTPPPPHHTSVKDSITDLQHEIDDFFSIYTKEPTKRILNPFFGDLDYEMQIKLLYKHALHHLRQFGVTV
jgi:hypothetical protein